VIGWLDRVEVKGGEAWLFPNEANQFGSSDGGDRGMRRRQQLDSTGDSY